MSAVATTRALAYDERGQGLPVVFLHGLTFDRKTWTPIVERLADDFRCVTIDLPAHGESAGPPLPLSELAGEIRRLLEGLEIERPLVVGHSIGAVVALLYAASHPVAGLVDIDQSLDVRAFAERVHCHAPSLQGDRFTESFELFRRSMGVDDLPERERARLSASWQIDQQLVMGYFAEVLGESPDALQRKVEGLGKAVRSPWLGVFGQNLPSADRRLLHELIPHAELEEWPGRGHLVHLAEPERFAARLSAFARHCAEPPRAYEASRESNVALLMGLLGRCVNGHDLGALDLYTDNPRVAASVTRTVTGFPDVRLRVEWVICEGDMVSAWIHLEGTHLGGWRGVAPTGRRTSVRGSLTVMIAAGKVADFWLCADWLRMHQQLDLPTA